MSTSMATYLNNLFDEHESGMYIWGISIRVWSLVVATPCVIVACLISFISMIHHCSRNRDPEIRKHLLRILFMVPIYGLNALLALVWPFNVELFTLIRESYEAITIFSFFSFLTCYLGGESRLRYLLSLESQEEDEFHLYRLAQNLKNQDVINLPNKNFIHDDASNQHITNPIDTTSLNYINDNQELVHSDDIGNYYSYHYKLNVYERNRTWWQKLPLIRSFYPPPDFTGKRPQELPPPETLSPLQQHNKTPKNQNLNAPLLLNSPSSSSSLSSSSIFDVSPPDHRNYGTIAGTPSQPVPFNKSNLRLNNSSNLINADHTMSFRTRTVVNSIKATDEERANFKRIKEERLKKQKTLNSFNTSPSQLDSPSSRTSNGLNTSPSESTHPDSLIQSGGDFFHSGVRPVDNDQNQDQISINMLSSPPGEKIAELKLDPKHHNRFIDHNNQIVIAKGQDERHHSHKFVETSKKPEDVDNFDGFELKNDKHDKKNTALFDSQNSDQLEKRVVTLEYHPQLTATERTYYHLFPCNYFFEPVTPERFIFISKFSTLQYVPVQIVCAVLAMIGHSLGWYHPGSWKGNNLYPYLSVILNTSQIFAMYGLFFFLHHFGANLKPINAMTKALTIKAVVFATFWQSCLITLYYLYFPWCSHNGSDPDIRRCTEGEWDSVEQATGVNNFLICVEMFIFALIHLRVFSWREFGRRLMYDQTKPVLRSVIEFFSPEDIMQNVSKNVTLGNFKQVLLPEKIEKNNNSDPFIIQGSPTQLEQQGPLMSLSGNINDGSDDNDNDNWHEADAV
jgi:hypothetical protein